MKGAEPGRDSVGQSRLRVALYLRVSTADQNPELQLRELTEYAIRQGWDVVGSYEDTISGTKANRPSLTRLLADAGSNKFDCVAVWKLDRFGRSLVGCLNHIQELEERGIRFVAVTQNLDTDQRNPASRFLLHVLAAAAEFERSLILERTKAGRTRYRQDFEKGKVGKTVNSRSGKNLPPHRPQRIFSRDEIHSLRRRGCSLRQIAQKLGIGLGTVTRTLQSTAEVTHMTT